MDNVKYKESDDELLEKHSDDATEGDSRTFIAKADAEGVEKKHVTPKKERPAHDADQVLKALIAATDAISKGAQKGEFQENDGSTAVAAIKNITAALENAEAAEAVLDAPAPPPPPPPPPLSKLKKNPQLAKSDVKGDVHVAVIESDDSSGVEKKSPSAIDLLKSSLPKQDQIESKDEQSVKKAVAVADDSSADKPLGENKVADVEPVKEEPATLPLSDNAENTERKFNIPKVKLPKLDVPKPDVVKPFSADVRRSAKIRRTEGAAAKSSPSLVTKKLSPSSERKPYAGAVVRPDMQTRRKLEALHEEPDIEKQQRMAARDKRIFVGFIVLIFVIYAGFFLLGGDDSKTTRVATSGAPTVTVAKVVDTVKKEIPELPKLPVPNLKLGDEAIKSDKEEVATSPAVKTPADEKITVNYRGQTSTATVQEALDNVNAQGKVSAPVPVAQDAKPLPQVLKQTTSPVDDRVLYRLLNQH